MLYQLSYIGVSAIQPPYLTSRAPGVNATLAWAGRRHMLPAAAADERPRMTTNAPLPELADPVPQGAAGPGDEALAAPWRRAGEGAFWLSRGAWAMRAVALWWEQTKRRRAPRVWLPDYFCNASTSPLREGGARLHFYPVGLDLEPRWEACEALAGAAPPDLFVLVHYFGRPADGAAAGAFCRRHGAALIEDAAHALSPADGIGSAGDFVFYSPHKVLAVPDGALLLVADAAAIGSMAAAVAGLGRAAPRPWPWLAKRLAQKALPGAALRRLAARRGPAFDDDPPYAPAPATAAPSRLARRLLARQGRRLAEVAGVRRRNAEALRRAVAAWPGCHLFEPPAAPYRLAVRCDDAPARFAALRRRGCPVESWPDLAPEVLAEAERHADALLLRRSLLLLPVHQTAAADRLVATCA